MIIYILVFFCILTILKSQPPCENEALTFGIHAYDQGIVGWNLYYSNGQIPECPNRDLKTCSVYFTGVGAEEGNSPIYLKLETVKDLENPEYTVHGVDCGWACFALTAIDEDGFESDLSENIECFNVTESNEMIHFELQQIVVLGIGTLLFIIFGITITIILLIICLGACSGGTAIGLKVVTDVELRERVRKSFSFGRKNDQEVSNNY